MPNPRQIGRVPRGGERVKLDMARPVVSHRTGRAPSITGGRGCGPQRDGCVANRRARTHTRRGRPHTRRGRPHTRRGPGHRRGRRCVLPSHRGSPGRAAVCFISSHALIFSSAAYSPASHASCATASTASVGDTRDGSPSIGRPAGRPAGRAVGRRVGRPMLVGRCMSA
eukprot:5921867-Prymnesium_polylepis.1